MLLLLRQNVWHSKQTYSASVFLGFRAIIFKRAAPLWKQRNRVSAPKEGTGVHPGCRGRFLSFHLLGLVKVQEELQFEQQERTRLASEIERKATYSRPKLFYPNEGTFPPLLFFSFCFLFVF